MKALSTQVLLPSQPRVRLSKQLSSCLFCNDPREREARRSKKMCQRPVVPGCWARDTQHVLCFQDLSQKFTFAKYFSLAQLNSPERRLQTDHTIKEQQRNFGLDIWGDSSKGNHCLGLQQHDYNAGYRVFLSAMEPLNHGLHSILVVQLSSCQRLQMSVQQAEYHPQTCFVQPAWCLNIFLVSYQHF